MSCSNQKPPRMRCAGTNDNDYGEAFKKAALNAAKAFNKLAQTLNNLKK